MTVSAAVNPSERTDVADATPFDAKAVLQALFNQSEFSDLTLVVQDTEFHCHGVVLEPVCLYLSRFIAWPGGTDVDCQRVQIDLPPIEIPKPFRSRRPHPGSYYVGLFLRVVYGLYDLGTESDVGDVFGIAQVADFLLCGRVHDRCDEILSRTVFGTKNALCAAFFARKYSLRRTLPEVNRIIAEELYEFRHDPVLYALDNDHFASIMELCPYNDSWSLAIPFAFATGQVAIKDRVDLSRGILDDDKRALFRKVITRLCTSWDGETIRDVARMFSECDNCFNGCESDQLFLYKILTKGYRQFYG